MFDFRIGRENFPNLWFKENFFCVFSAKSNIKPISIHLKDLYGHMTYGLSKILVGNAIWRTLILTKRNRVTGLSAKYYIMFI